MTLHPDFPQSPYAILEQAGGEIISPFIDMADIAFHAVKARMPVASIKTLLGNAEGQTEKPHLFIYPGVMFFRQTGQSMVSNVEGDDEEAEYPQTEAEQPPVAAILDGVPNLQHQALKNRVNFDFESMREIIRVQNTESGEWEEQWTGDYIFENEWQSFRTKKDRSLELTSIAHECPPGRRKITVKVVDIFGNDTMTIVEVGI